MQPALSRGVRVAAAAGVLFGYGCVQWFAEDVASGAARLTIRNVAAVATLAADDEVCGFASNAAVLTTNGEVGGRGSATWTITDCRISLPEMTDISTDCLDGVTRARGTFVVSGRQTVRGRLTGDTETPVVPDEIDAAELTFTEITFDDFEVRTSESANALTIRSGSLSAVMKPRLGEDQTNGACAVVTPHVTFESVRYHDADVSIDTGSRVIEATIPSSDFYAQNGRGPLGENALGGSLAVWNSEPLPIPNDGDGLDPDYDAVRFRHGFACTEGLTMPLVEACDVTQGMGEGAARLSIKNLGTIAAAAAADENCGFASPAVIEQAHWDGSVGRPGGQVTYTIADCTIDFGSGSLQATDCTGVQTRASGLAVVSGTMTVKGYLTGDPLEPAVPTSWQPATITIGAELIDFVARDSNSDAALLIERGHVEGTVTPVTAVDTTLGACSLTTPHARISNVRASATRGVLESGSIRLGLTMADASLTAVNGVVDGIENYIDGWVQVDGELVSIPFDDRDLNPDYDPVSFRQSFDCEPNLRMPRSNEDCNFDRTLAHGAARLTMFNYVLALKALNDDSACGFAGIDGVLPQDLVGEPNGELTARWYVDGCTLSAPEEAPLRIRDDCIGVRTDITGSFTATATKQATGAAAATNPPILPSHPNAVVLEAQHVTFDDLAIWDLVDDPADLKILIIHEGRMSGREWVYTAPALLPEGAFIIPTPVIDYDNIRLADAEVSLVVGAKQFHFTVDDSDLEGFNGRYGDRFNELEGRIRVNGRWYDMPPEFEEPTLDPFYDQELFDASYACEPNLMNVLPWDP